MTLLNLRIILAIKKMNMKPILLFTLIFLAISCKQNTEEKIVPEVVPQEEPAEESHESVDGVITLNDGELWLANPETTTGIENMKKRMDSFTEKENQEAYATLKEGLEADFTELFQKCTMKGEAHNQLHNYLFPFIDLFDGLESADLETCKKSFTGLNIRLEEYFDYFI